MNNTIRSNINESLLLLCVEFVDTYNQCRWNANKERNYRDVSIHVGAIHVSLQRQRWLVQ